MDATIRTVPASHQWVEGVNALLERVAGQGCACEDLSCGSCVAADLRARAPYLHYESGRMQQQVELVGERL
jgi:hypothetical protein